MVTDTQVTGAVTNSVLLKHKDMQILCTGDPSVELGSARVSQSSSRNDRLQARTQSREMKPAFSMSKPVGIWEVQVYIVRQQTAQHPLSIVQTFLRKSSVFFP